METAMPVIASIIGVLLTALMTTGVLMLKDIRSQLIRMNGRVGTCEERIGTLQIADARVDERIATLLKTIEKAHSRIDDLESPA